MGNSVSFVLSKVGIEKVKILGKIGRGIGIEKVNFLSRIESYFFYFFWSNFILEKVVGVSL